MKSIAYYNDGDYFVASIDNGENGFFSRSSLAVSEQWKFIVPGSIKWDEIYQDIHYSHHNLSPSAMEAIAQLPKLPEVPQFVKMKWVDNFRIKDKLDISRFPFLAKDILDNNNFKEYWFILTEDLYETFFGDGIFLYCHGEILNCSSDADKMMMDAKKIAESRNPPYNGYVDIRIRKFSMSVENSEIVPSNYLPEVHEDFSITKIIERIEEILESMGKIKWGARDEKRSYIDK